MDRFLQTTLLQKQTKWYENLIFFIAGWLGFQLVGTIVSAFFSSALANFQVSALAANTAINVITYSLLFLAYGVYLWYRRDIAGWIFKGFLPGGGLWRAVIIFWCCNIVASLYNMIVSASVPWFGINENQSSIESMSGTFFFPMLIVTAIFAPVCEELTYRGGLQTLIARWNKVAAVLLASLIFAFIHFDWEGSISDAIAGDPFTLYRELLNMPIYYLSGLGLGLAYQNTGNISASIFAHFLNNFFAIILA